MEPPPLSPQHRRKAEAARSARSAAPRRRAVPDAPQTDASSSATREPQARVAARLVLLDDAQEPGMEPPPLPPQHRKRAEAARSKRSGSRAAQLTTESDDASSSDSDDEADEGAPGPPTLGAAPPELPDLRPTVSGRQRGASMGRDAMAQRVAHRLRVQVDTRLHHGDDEFGEEKKPSEAMEALQWLRAVLDKVEEIFTGKSPGQKAKVHHRRLSSRSKSAHVINDTVGVVMGLRKHLDTLEPLIIAVDAAAATYEEGWMGGKQGNGYRTFIGPRGVLTACLDYLRGKLLSLLIVKKEAKAAARAANDGASPQNSPRSSLDSGSTKPQIELQMVEPEPEPEPSSGSGGNEGVAEGAKVPEAHLMEVNAKSAKPCEQHFAS